MVGTADENDAESNKTHHVPALTFGGWGDPRLGCGGSAAAINLKSSVLSVILSSWRAPALRLLLSPVYWGFFKADAATGRSSGFLPRL